MRLAREEKKGRFIAMVTIFICLTAVFIFTLAKNQIVDGKKDTASNTASVESTEVKATRGQILDRNGKVIVGNRQGNDVVFNAAEPVRLVGTVFLQPLVALVVALRCGNDPVGVGVTVFFQPPTGAVCGGGVKKQVVAVKHIEYGIFFARSLPVIRQVNKSPAGQPVRGNADIKRFNHTKSPNSSRASARPKDWYYCTAKTDL